ncbi:MAG: TolC family protein [Rikenellaceae bacterium]|nr:TolC family protein [Rikenellaceae bacterium]
MRKPLFFLLSMLVCAAAAAQSVRTPASTVPVTFDQALDLALGGSPQLEAVQFEQRAAMFERRAALGLRFPSIGVTGAYVLTNHAWEIKGGDIAGGLFDDLGNMGIDIPANIATGAEALLDRFGFPILPKDFATFGASATLPIFTGGKINAANRAARLNEQTAGEKERQVEGALMSELVERYYGLLLANQAVEVRRQVVEAMKQHLADALALEQNGVIPRSERLFVEVKLYEAERDLTDAITKASTTRAALGNTLNSEEDFEPISAMFLLSDLPTLNTFREWALEKNPQLRQVELGRQLAVQGVTLARSEFYPQVAAMGYGSLYRYRLSSRFPTWAVGAGVTFNIFDGLQKEHKLSAARNTVRQVESLQYKAEKDVSLLVEQLYNELLNNADRMPSVDKALEFAEEYLRVMNVSFREGVGTSVDVIDAELNLAKNRIDKLQTAYEYDLTLARLFEAAGVSEYFPRYARGQEAVPVRF